MLCYEVSDDNIFPYSNIKFFLGFHLTPTCYDCNGGVTFVPCLSI